MNKIKQKRIDFEFEFFCNNCDYTRKDNTHYYEGGGVPETGILPNYIFDWERKNNIVIGNSSPPAYCPNCNYQMLARWEV